MSVEQDLRAVAAMATTAADMAAAGQRSAMALLLAEMQALTSLMPGLGPAPVSAAQDAAEARQRAEDARTEAAFDNMPV